MYGTWWAKPQREMLWKSDVPQVRLEARPQRTDSERVAENWESH